jgi:hypothetical protein
MISLLSASEPGKNLKTIKILGLHACELGALLAADEEGAVVDPTLDHSIGQRADEQALLITDQEKPTLKMDGFDVPTDEPLELCQPVRDGDLLGLFADAKVKHADFLAH